MCAFVWSIVVYVVYVVDQAGENNFEILSIYMQASIMFVIGSITSPCPGLSVGRSVSQSVIIYQKGGVLSEHLFVLTSTLLITRIRKHVT